MLARSFQKLPRWCDQIKRDFYSQSQSSSLLSDLSTEGQLHKYWATETAQLCPDILFAVSAIFNAFMMLITGTPGLTSLLFVIIYPAVS